jgi:putative transposase
VAICCRMKKSREAYYKHIRKRTQERIESHIVHELVMEQRTDMPRLGGKKLYVLIGDTLKAHRLRMGRDKLFSWLRNHDLLVQPKRQHTRTTNSSHRFRVHQNLIKDQAITQSDQVWVSDITYLRLQKGFCYLALITDAYSRKIVGYHVNETLELNGCLKALQMACGQRKNTLPTIHHSDRGIQYCSNQYVDQLKNQDIKISMAEAGNCYENAMAERVNGILKDEFNLDRTFSNLEQARKSTIQAIKTYNTRRPHMSIEMKKPAELYAA